jgi:Cof subfamily protein (haloacid dehalogenase superfamily)
MSYKAIFSDIDGTFLTTQHEVLPTTATAVKQLTEEGIPFVLVSGRMPAAIQPILKSMNIRIPLICYSGALVWLADGHEVYSKRMPAKETARILRKIETRWPQTVVNYYAGDTWYVRETCDPHVQCEIAITQAVPREAEFISLLTKGQLPHKLLCMCEPAVCEAMECELQAAFPLLHVVRSSPILLEIMEVSISKANGIRMLLNDFGLLPQEIIAFGDNYNDIDMLAYAGLGVAMGNAPQEIKKAADEITASNDEDGIAKFLKNIGLLRNFHHSSNTGETQPIKRR